jgi:hypothetical protein
MAKAKGVLPSFQLFTPARRGTSLETNRTTSRRALALIQIWASEASLPLSHVASSLSRLTPISRRYRVAPTERARKVLLPWGRCLAVSWSLVMHSIAQMYKRCKMVYPTPILPHKEGPFIPGLKEGAFWSVHCKFVLSGWESSSAREITEIAAAPL